MADDLGRIAEGLSPLIIALGPVRKLLQDTWRWRRRRASCHDAEQASGFEDFVLDSEGAARPPISRLVGTHGGACRERIAFPRM